MSSPTLFMLLLGCKPPGRHIEQHDIFFGIADSMKDLVPEIKAYWPEPDKIHIDAWREVNRVDDYQIKIIQRIEKEKVIQSQSTRLFFINLGGYQENRFEEQHYILLSAKQTREEAIQESMDSLFFQNNHFPGANSHIDDKYGIDVDNVYEIEEMLLPVQKERYIIQIVPAIDLEKDRIHLGYFKLASL